MKPYQLIDGLSYCEAYRVYSNEYESNKDDENKKPLISRSGHYMILIRWKVIDSAGNVGFIDDYISEKANFKILNLENALSVSKLFDPITKNFHVNMIRNSACGCTIKKDSKNPQYGSKIISYVPLEFYITASRRNQSNVA